MNNKSLEKSELTYRAVDRIDNDVSSTECPAIAEIIFKFS